MIFLHRSNIVVSTGTVLSDIEEGELVKLNENGSPVEFYVAKHDYEPDLNGAGRTLLVRKDCYDSRAWDAGNVNAYANSDIDAWFNGDYKNLLDPSIQTAIGTTKFYYTPGNGNNTVGTLERAVFTLSLTELGLTNTNANVEGYILPTANTLKIAYRNNTAVDQWTRTPLKITSADAYCVNTIGNISGVSVRSNGYCSRPTFTLPSTIRADDTGLIV